jgi:hypothetical protein
MNIKYSKSNYYNNIIDNKYSRLLDVISIFSIIVYIAFPKYSLLFLSILITSLFIKNPFKFKNSTLNYDAIIISFFSICYWIFSLNFTDYPVGFTKSHVLAAPLLYLLGAYSSSTQLLQRRMYLQLMLVFTALAVPSWYLVFSDIAAVGFTGGERNVRDETIFSLGDASATQIAGSLVLTAALGGAIFAPRSFPEHSARIFFGGLASVLCLICAFRLGSRTLLFAWLISVVYFAVWTRFGRRPLKFILTFLGFLSVAIWFLGALESSGYTVAYQDRDLENLLTFGGRLYQWAASFSLMVEFPFGWLLAKNGYSHNFWFDIARVAGAPAFFISLAITVRFYLAVRQSLRVSGSRADWKAYITICVIGILALFLMEPILDGYIPVFLTTCWFWGILRCMAQDSKSANFHLARSNNFPKTAVRPLAHIR